MKIKRTRQSCQVQGRYKSFNADDEEAERVEELFMNEEKLIISAQELKQPSEEATRIYYDKIDTIAEELNRIMLGRPDVDRLIGMNNMEMMENNSRNYLRFMGAIFHSYDPIVLVQTSLWAFRAYRAHGFYIEYWPANLDTTVQILKKELPEKAYKEIYPFFEWLIVNIPAFVIITDKMLKDESKPYEYI